MFFSSCGFLKTVKFKQEKQYIQKFMYHRYGMVTVLCYSRDYDLNEMKAITKFKQVDHTECDSNVSFDISRWDSSIGPTMKEHR